MSEHDGTGQMTIKTRPRRSHRTMLAPVAYNELVMPSLRLARSARIVRIIAKSLLIALGLLIVLSAFAPWQQSVTGKGNVVAYAPLERQQTIEAPIKGRIIRWGEGVFENARVERGQVIVEIQDLDPLLTSRLAEQLFASQQQLEAAKQQFEANQRSLEVEKTIVDVYFKQIAAYEDVKEQIVASANAYIDMAQQKINAEQQHLLEQQAALSQVEADYERQTRLYQERIASELKFQEAERKFREGQAKVAKAEANFEAAKNELVAKQRDRDAKARKAQVDIDYADAMHKKAKGDVNKAESDVAKASADLNKVEKEVSEMQVKVARQQSQVVLAPFDGFVVEITPNQGGQMVKEGDMLCAIVPDTADRAVQIWLVGNDAPLVEPGRHVRLQFEGWPAVQSAGWPSIAVGTFGGTVVSVDSIDDGKGQYRILILPDEQETDWPGAIWPEGRFLRQGVRANGWVLLERVPLWFEIWRRMNAFPPVVTIEEEEKEKLRKPPKVGKAL